jgi:hypothetical protein
VPMYPIFGEKLSLIMTTRIRNQVPLSNSGVHYACSAAESVAVVGRSRLKGTYQGLALLSCCRT